MSKLQPPAFVNKLYKMVEESSTNKLIKWGINGDTFVVTKPEEFAKEVLPKYFKHNNFSSFVRQLNMYGFHKVPHLQQGVLQRPTGEEEDTSWEFYNDHFRRGHLDLLLNVKRKINEEKENQLNSLLTQYYQNKGHPGLHTDAEYPSGTLSTDFAAILGEMSQLKRAQTAILAKVNQIENEHAVLWREMVANKEKNGQQQGVIDKILRFLASVFSSDKRQETLMDFVNSSGSALIKKRRMLTEESILDHEGQLRRQMDDLIYPDAEEQSPRVGADMVAAPSTPQQTASPAGASRPYTLTPHDDLLGQLDDINLATYNVNDDIETLQYDLDHISKVLGFSEPTLDDHRETNTRSLNGNGATYPDGSPGDSITDTVSIFTNPSIPPSTVLYQSPGQLASNSPHTSIRDVYASALESHLSSDTPSAMAASSSPCASDTKDQGLVPHQPNVYALEDQFNIEHYFSVDPSS